MGVVRHSWGMQWGPSLRFLLKCSVWAKKHKAHSQPAHRIPLFLSHKSWMGFDFRCQVQVLCKCSSLNKCIYIKNTFGCKVECPHPSVLSYWQLVELKVLYGFLMTAFRHVRAPAFCQRPQWKAPMSKTNCGLKTLTGHNCNPNEEPQVEN